MNAFDPHPYHIVEPWVSERPHILVVTCSDGRIQGPVDEFLHEELGIASYDRLYLPGGPGALAHARSGDDGRASAQWAELEFLLDAHQIERVILMFHSPAEAGPKETMCADYSRLYPGLSMAELRDQQVRDGQLLVQELGQRYPSVLVQPCRLEVESNYEIEVRFLPKG